MGRVPGSGWVAGRSPHMLLFSPYHSEPSTVRAVVTVILASVVLSGAAHAQCLVPKESNEAKLLAFSAVPIAFSPAGNLSVMSAGSVRLSFDASYVPTASD